MLMGRGEFKFFLPCHLGHNFDKNILEIVMENEYNYRKIALQIFFSLLQLILKVKGI